MLSNKKYGNVYEILLPEGKYVYACLISEKNFGIFNYISKNKISDVNILLHKGFKMHSACDEMNIDNNTWKYIGNIDLESEGITFPDLAIYLAWNVSHSYQNSQVMSKGNAKSVSFDTYDTLVKSGRIYGFFAKPSAFEMWLSMFFEDYPEGVLDFRIMSERMKEYKNRQ